MEKRQVLLVDSFADQPTGGRQVAVLPTDVPASQRRAIASEFATSGVVAHDDGELTYTDCDGSQAVVSAAVAGYSSLSNRGVIDGGTHEFHVEGTTDPADPFLVELTDDGRVAFELPTHTPREVSATSEEFADALGVDASTLDDVGADLPAAKTEAFGGTTLVPVNFLQHLSGARPDVGALASILEQTETSRLVAFTFDTLGPETEVHMRVFDPTAADNERPASGVGAGACVALCSRHAVFGGDKDEIRIECGQFSDRPGTLAATVTDQPTISGTSLTVLDGNLAVPADEDDDIIEV